MKINKIGNILTISSSNNSLIKKIRRLILKNSKKNDLDFVGEGEIFLNEAILNDWFITDLLCNIKMKDSFFKSKVFKKLEKMGTNIFFSDIKIFQKVLKKSNPQNFIFVIKKKYIIPKRIEKNHFSIVLENLKDPGNVGTILRTAESFGVNHCFFLGDTVNPYAMEVIRASTGSIFSLNFSFISEQGIGNWFKNNNIHVIGTSPNSNLEYDNFSWKYPLSLAIGNEQFGLSKFLKSKSINVLKISTKGRTKSLNVAVASGIFMEKIFRNFPKLN